MYALAKHLVALAKLDTGVQHVQMFELCNRYNFNATCKPVCASSLMYELVSQRACIQQELAKHSSHNAHTRTLSLPREISAWCLVVIQCVTAYHPSVTARSRSVPSMLSIIHLIPNAQHDISKWLLVQLQRYKGKSIL